MIRLLGAAALVAGLLGAAGCADKQVADASVPTSGLPPTVKEGPHKEYCNKLNAVEPLEITHDPVALVSLGAGERAELKQTLTGLVDTAPDDLKQDLVEVVKILTVLLDEKRKPDDTEAHNLHWAKAEAGGWSAEHCLP